MKQKNPTSTTPRTTFKHQQQQQHSTDTKSLQTVPQTASTTTRFRVRASSKTKESPKTPPEIVNRLSPISSTRAKSVPPELKNNSKAKRSIVMKSIQEVETSHKGSTSSREVEETKVAVVAPPRRRRIEDDHDAKEKKELLEKLEASESLIKNLQSEVKALKDELEHVKSLKIELESQNIKLTQNLATAEANLAAVSTSSTKKETIGEHKSSKFKDIQKLIADKLERSKVKKEANHDAIFVKASIPIPTPTISHAIPQTASIGTKSTTNQCLLPPPPPPPPPIPSRPLAKLANTHKASATVQLFHSLKSQDAKKDSRGSMSYPHKPITNSAHNSIVGEIQNRSAHLLAIRLDIQTKGEFINELIKKVVDAAYVDIEDVLKFVDWLDGELSTLADERAVLKHFKWPEKKADAMREAAVEYRELKMLEQEISSYKDDPDIPCVASLKRMASLLDKSERSIQKLVVLRNSAICSYQVYNIPTAWMLDSGITSKIKQASMTLVKMYMKRLTMELESIRNSDRESSQDSLLLQGVHFAYRAHQFAGGLDSETLCAFEEIRQRVPGNLAGSRELLAGIASS
ncbi:unnamed protein product [Lathyrus oleraceus]